MTQVGTQHDASPTDPVRAALDDGALRDGLLEHAQVGLGKRLCHRSIADRNDAAMAAVQETCIRALEKRHEYDAALPVRPWLHGIMNFVLRETIRKVRGLPAQEPDDTVAWEALAIDLTPDITETVPNRLAVNDYLGKLRVEDRQALELRFFENLEHDEIAGRLGISIGCARVRLCRALTALKAIACSLREETP